MAKVVSLLNMKGGVGKTMLTHNLALEGAWRFDLDVLVVDLDPQFNVSQSLMTENRFRTEIVEKGEPTVVDIFEKDRPRLGAAAVKPDGALNPIVPILRWQGAAGTVDLIPSRLEFAWTLRNSAGKERYLKNFLARHQGKYDLVLIDCPPTESMATHAAYLASDFVLVPIKPEFLATIGLPLLATSLATFHSNEDHRVEVAGIVFNDVNYSYEHNRSIDEVTALAAKNAWYVFQTQITHSDSYPKGTRHRVPITRTDYARQWKKDEFVAFLTEFLGRVGVKLKVPA